MTERIFERENTIVSGRSLVCLFSQANESYNIRVRVADCPKCGSPASPAGHAAFCLVCGWNQSVAAQAIRQDLLALLFAFLVIAAASLFTKRWTGILSISGLAAVWFCAAAIKLMWQRRNLEKPRVASFIQDLPRSTQIGGDGGNVIPARFSNFPTLAIPRRLKMKRVFRWLAFLLAFIALVFADVSYSLLMPPYKAADDPQVGRKMVLIPIAISCALGWGWWLERRRKRLLRFGQVGFAVVLASSAGHNSLLPGITYKFQAGNGKEIEDFDQDWTDSFHEGMLVPIFYDSLKPENHVAICASFYDIKCDPGNHPESELT